MSIYSERPEIRVELPSFINSSGDCPWNDIVIENGNLISSTCKATGLECIEENCAPWYWAYEWLM